MSCQFSSPNSGLYPVFSKDSSYIASVAGSRLNIKNAKTLEQINIFQCVDKIEKIEFSPDSCYVLCGLLSRNAIQVFSLFDKEWTCRINEGSAGIRDVYWAPDSRHIISESDYGIQISIWSLLNETSVIIPLPKENYTLEGILSRTNSFSICGSFLAVVHSIDAKDQIGIYGFTSGSKKQSTTAVGLVTKFPSKSVDIALISWHLGHSCIITIDNPLTYCFCIYKPSGELLIKYEAYSYALGIKSFDIYQNPHVSNVKAGFIAIGSFDGKIRLLSMSTWELVFTLPLIHPQDMERGFNCTNMLLTVELIGKNLKAIDSEDIDVSSRKLLPSKFQQLKSYYFYRSGFLVSKDTADNISHAMIRSKQLLFEIDSTEKNSSFFALQKLTCLPKEQNIKSSVAKANSFSSVDKYSNFGVKWIGWSSDGKFLAAREGKYPRCLWIWKPLDSILIDLIVQLDPITSAAWRPFPITVIDVDDNDGDNTNYSTDPFEVLAYCTGNNRLYFWTAVTGAIWANITPCASDGAGTDDIHRSSTNFSACALQWSENGNQLLIQGKEAHCICNIDFKDLKFVNS